MHTETTSDCHYYDRDRRRRLPWPVVWNRESERSFRNDCREKRMVGTIVPCGYRRRQSVVVVVVVVVEREDEEDVVVVVIVLVVAVLVVVAERAC